MTAPRFDDHGEWDALAVGWALSALDDADGERFADHLPECDRCTATVRESLYTVADLAYGVPDEQPPPALKSRLMAAVAAEPRILPAPDEDGEWPLGAPHPGTPGYDPGADRFARPGSAADGQGPVRQGPEAYGPGPVDRERSDGAGRVGDFGPSGGAGRVSASDGAGPVGDLGLSGGAGRVEGSAPGSRPEEPYRTGPDPGASAWPPAGREADTGRTPGRGRHAASADDTVVPFRRRRPVRRISVAAAAAAVLAFVAGLAAWNVQLRSDRDQLQQVVAQREAALAQLTSNGPARVAALAPFGKPTDPRQATLVVRGDRVEIIVEGLPETSGDQRYWLWTLRCDTQPEDLRPIRGFEVTQPAFSVRSIGSDPGLASATCFAISREVGTATPTAPREVVLAGQPG